MEFSPEQKRVISARGKNLLVSAAAGSGKTTVLVERVLSLLREGVHIDEILIVTFTRAASADMRMKLYRRLSELAQAGDERMYEETERLEYASISTLHSFCTRVIRQNFVLADVDPEFRVLEDAENALMEDNALSAVLEDAYQRMDEGMALLSEGRSPEEIRGMVQALYGFLSARPDARSWFAEALRLMDGDGKAWTEVLARRAEEAADEAAALTECALELSRRPDGPGNMTKALESDLDFIRSLHGLDYGRLRGALDAFSPMRLGSSKGMNPDPDIAEQAKKLRDRVKDILRLQARDFVSLPEEESMEDIRMDRPAFRTLGEMAFDMQNRLREAKKERGALTFNDLEHLTIRVLQDEGAREKLRRKYKYVFVDEYQDTSDIQEAIVSRVAGENNRFCVGDVKQSIYRFRNAEPALFMDACRRSLHDESSELIVLGRNYRSRGAVIDFVNLIFSRVMNGGQSEIIYDEDARLHRGRDFEGADAPVELMLVDKSGETDAAEAGDAPENEEGAEDLMGAEREALLIAKRIHELQEEDKNLRYRDICVITRVRKDVLAPMAAVLAASGIPAYADGSDSVFDALEVMVTLSVLKLLVTRRSELELLCVLRSPMFGLTADQLARIRVASPADSLWQAVENARNDCPQADRFVRLCDAWRELSANLRLDQLIRRILRDTDFYVFAGALPGGRRRQANLDMLCQQALAYERTRGSSLSGFLEYMESMRSSGDSSGAHELGENDDVVRLMTAHKSKGLEFKVVFASMLGRQFARSGSDPDVYADKQLGLGWMHADMTLGSQRPTLCVKAIRALDRQKELAEELRVLYVTLTRAQERLILTGTSANAALARIRWKAAQSYPNLYSSALDIACAAALNSPGAEALGGKTDPSRPRVNVRVFSASSLSAPSQAKGEDLIGALEAILAMETEDPALKEAFCWTYPESSLPYAPVKLSVTGLEKEFTGGEEMPRLVRAPAFLTGEGKSPYTDRGTAVHAALRFLDLSAFAAVSSREEACVEAARQLNAMADRQLLSKEEREMVKPAYLADFALSPLGRRAARSEEVHREWSFSLFVPTNRLISGYPEEGRMLVQGTIDLCFTEDGGWVLADYKTERSDDDEALLKRYSTQLGAYAEALERITGRPVKQIYIFLARENRAVEFVRTAQ